MTPIIQVPLNLIQGRMALVLGVVWLPARETKVVFRVVASYPGMATFSGWIIPKSTPPIALVSGPRLASQLLNHPPGLRHNPFSAKRRHYFFSEAGHLLFELLDGGPHGKSHHYLLQAGIFSFYLS